MLLVAGALLTACSASGAGGGEHVRRPGPSATPDRKVTATNDSVAGYTTDVVLRQLTFDQDVIADVRGADSVTIEVGANDVPHSAACGTSLDCYARGLDDAERRQAIRSARDTMIPSGPRT